jgi:hypothetical protein
MARRAKNALGLTQLDQSAGVHDPDGVGDLTNDG